MPHVTAPHVVTAVSLNRNFVETVALGVLLVPFIFGGLSLLAFALGERLRMHRHTRLPC